MNIDITIKIGGEAGQGIQTVGHLLALACREAGLYIMAINDFESRIRGGHSFFQIRICNKPVHAPHHKVHLLVALNQETYDLHKGELDPDGIAIMDENEKPATGKVLLVPFVDLAKEAGGKIFSNTVAAGACLALLGTPFELCKSILAKQFEAKGPDILEKNIRAADLGYQATKDVLFKWAFEWRLDPPKGSLIDGSKAIALGALAADCRFGSLLSHVSGYRHHGSPGFSFKPLSPDGRTSGR